MDFSPNKLILFIAAWLAFSNGLFTVVNGQLNYKDALAKAIIFLEAQRSGKLVNSRLPWRGDSGLDDGKLSNIDLVGGYYDAGDNVKYGLPMAFTITTLAWSAVAFKPELEAVGEMENVLAGIKWGTDYFLKASAKKNFLWVQVGDPVADHQCWVRPENMQTPRTLYHIDEKTPGTEIAAETAAAMAASSMVFRPLNRTYSRSLLNKAKLLFEFAKSHKGTYDGECPFYCSFSGYNDELLWAATWLYRATHKEKYLSYITQEAISNAVDEFNWDLKFAGAQVILAEMYLRGEKKFEDFKRQADSFVCSALPESPFHQLYISPGGLLHLRDGANTQYPAGISLVLTVYGDALTKYRATVTCGNQQFDGSHLTAFAKKQMDYLLGQNPLGTSYMVGFGSKHPKQAHHRGASMPVLSPSTVVNCGMSFADWFNKNQPNPNELTGAIVGGPDRYDNFNDKRWDSPKTEPVTYTNSQAIGVLAKLAAHEM